MYFSNLCGELRKPVAVTINNEKFETQVYDGVQKFISPPTSLKIKAELIQETLKQIEDRVILGDATLQDYIKCHVSMGLSVNDLCENVESFIEENPNTFPEGFDELELYFNLHNPYWC